MSEDEGCKRLKFCMANAGKCWQLVARKCRKGLEKYDAVLGVLEAVMKERKNSEVMMMMARFQVKVRCFVLRQEAKEGEGAERF